MSLTTAQVAHYREHGWVAPIDIMSSTEAAALAARFAQAEADHPEQLHAENRNNAHLAFPFLAEVVTDQRIVACAQALVGVDVALWSTVLFIKEPDSAAFVSWHQDAYYMGLDSANFVTAWLALTPSILESGCVSVIPESHRERADHVDTFGSDNILTRGQQVDRVDASAAVHLELQPGQMSLHHPWLVHGSQPNRTSGRRIGLAMQSYLGSDVRPTQGEHHVTAIAGATPDPSFQTVPLPASECSHDANAIRIAANRALSTVLYEGAEKTRTL